MQEKVGSGLIFTGPFMYFSYGPYLSLYGPDKNYFKAKLLNPLFKNISNNYLFKEIKNNKKNTIFFFNFKKQCGVHYK